MADLFNAFKSDEKLSKELDKEIEKAPELSMEGLEVTPKMVLKLIGDAAKSKEEELIARLHKAAKAVKMPEVSVFGKDYSTTHAMGATYANPRSTRELEMLREELNRHYDYYRHNSCFHPVNGPKANKKRQKDLKIYCPSVAQVELRKDCAGHYQEWILVVAGLDDCPQSAFWMAFEF